MSSYFSGAQQAFGGTSYLTPAQQIAAIQATRRRDFRKKPKGRPTESLIGRLTPDIVETAVSQIAKSLIYTPVGLYDIGKAGVLDTRDLAGGDFTPERLGTIGKALALGTYNDLRHPLENPGYALLDAFAIGSLGLGTVGRVSRAAAEVNRATGGGSVTRLLEHGVKLPDTMTGATMGIAAPDVYGAAVAAKNSLIDSAKAGIQRANLSRQNTARDNLIPTPQTPKDYVSPPPLAGARDESGRLIDRPRFSPGPFAEQQIPQLAGRLDYTPEFSPLQQPHGYVPSGIEAGPHQPLFPRERTATLQQGEVPLGPLPTLRGQMGLLDEPPGHLPAIDPSKGPIPPGYIRQGTDPTDYQQARLQAAQAIREFQEQQRLLSERPTLTPETGPGTTAPFVAGPGGIEPPAGRSVLGRPGEAINPQGFRPTSHAPGGGIPILGPRLAEDTSATPHVRDPGPLPSEAAKAPLEPPKLTAAELKTAKVKGSDGHFAIVYQGEPTGIHFIRTHKASGAAAAKYTVFDGDKVVQQVVGGRNAERVAKDLSVEKIAPGSLEALDRELAATGPAEAVAPVMEEAPAATSGVAPEPVPESTAPSVTQEAGDQALRNSLTDEQMAATGELPAVFEHVYTSPEGVAAFRNTDKRQEVKVYGPDGNELKGADWATHKRAALAADKQTSSTRAAADATRGKEPQPEDLQALDEDVPPELKKLGFSYTQREFGINPRALQETFKLTMPQARQMAAQIHPGVRDLYRRYHAGDFTQHKLRLELQKLLQNELGKELGDKAFGMIMEAKGGVDVGPRQVGRIALKAFTAAPPRKTIPIRTREFGTERVDLGSLPEGVSRENLPEVKVRKDQQLQANVLASNNPMVRAVARSYYGILQALDNPYARGGAGNVANRALKRKINFENREMGRIVKAADAAGITDKMREIEQKTADKDPRDLTGTLGAAVDTSNQLAQIGILFLKPAYLSANFIGQVVLAMNDHSWNPTNVYKAVKVQREMFKNGALAGQRSKLIKKLMGEGFVSELKAGPGLSRGIERVHQKGSEWTSAILDTPFRDNAFINESRRQGLTDGASIGKLLDDAIVKGPGSDEYAQMADIARRANRNLIDYGRLNNTEKVFIRRAIFFYPWMKGASIYGARFAAEHPAALGIQTQMGKQEAVAQAEKVGEVPSYLEGVFKAGERSIPGLGKVPTIVNPQAISILGTPAQTLDVARGLVSGTPRQSDTLGEMLTPALSAGVAAAFNIDPFTGRKFGPGEGGLQAAWDTIAATPAPLRLYEQIQKAHKIETGEVDPSNVLFPMTASEAWGRFLGPGFGAAVGHPLADYTLNTREARSRALAEDRSQQSRVDAKKSLWRDYTAATQEEAKRVGIKLGKDFAPAMALKAEREANLAAFEQSKGGKMNKYDRLQADLSLLVRMKKINQNQAEQFSNRFAQATESEITSFRRDIGEEFFGQSVLSAYKSLLKERGAKVPFQ